MVTVVFEQDEECLRETEEEHRVDDAESKNIVEQHLGNHDDEWTGEAERHGEEQHVAPAEERGEGQDQRFIFDQEEAKDLSNQNTDAERDGKNIFEKDRTLRKMDRDEIGEHLAETYTGTEVIAKAESEHFADLAPSFVQATGNQNQTSCQTKAVEEKLMEFHFVQIGFLRVLEKQ